MLCFPSCGGSGFKRKRYGGKVWVGQRYTTKAMGDFKHGVGMAMIHQWDLESWVEMKRFGNSESETP